MAADRDRAAAEAQREKEHSVPSRPKREVEAGASRPVSSVVKRPTKVSGRRVGGVVASSNGTSSSGRAVKKLNVPGRQGRVGFM